MDWWRGWLSECVVVCVGDGLMACVIMRVCHCACRWWSKLIICECVVVPVGDGLLACVVLCVGDGCPSFTTYMPQHTWIFSFRCAFACDRAPLWIWYGFGLEFVLAECSIQRNPLAGIWQHAFECVSGCTVSSSSKLIAAGLGVCLLRDAVLDLISFSRRLNIWMR